MWEPGLSLFCWLIVARIHPSLLCGCSQRFCRTEQSELFLLQLSSLGGTFYEGNGRGGRGGGVESVQYPARPPHCSCYLVICKQGWYNACWVAFFGWWGQNSIFSSRLEFFIQPHAIPFQDTFPVTDAWQRNPFADLLEQIWERRKVQVHVSCALWSGAVELIRIPEFFTSLSVQIFLWRRRNYHQSRQRKAVVARSLAGNLKPSRRPKKHQHQIIFSFPATKNQTGVGNLSHSTPPAEV